MIHWTSAGAVAGPSTVQVRVSSSYAGRVQAGAPTPSRGLAPAELDENLWHFTEGLRGPRTRPCTRLVLSGDDLGARDDLSAPLAHGRGLGLQQVVMHLGGPDRSALHRSELGAQVDQVVVRVRSAADLHDTARCALRWATTAVLVLDAATLVDLSSLVRGVVAARPSRLVLTWPFPPASAPPAAEQVAAAITRVAPLLQQAALPWGVKGLPPCVVPGAPTWRSSNRWYVDADHQKSKALLFFPDVVRFAKAEACRFCQSDSGCDGLVEAWWSAGLVQPRPVVARAR